MQVHQDSRPPAEICNCAALRQAARHVTRRYDDALAPVALGLNQYSILARLERLGPLAIQDLAGNLVMDRSTLGHLLRPLQARGLLTIEPAPHDRRSRQVALTKSGRALLSEARPLWRRAQARFEAGFGAEDSARLRTTLKQIETLDLGGPSSAP